MTIPEDFEDAHNGLVELVDGLARGDISQEMIGEKVDEWRHADCRGATTLAEAAIKALQYELSSRGLKEGTEAVVEDLRALGRIEATLGTGTSSSDTGPGSQPDIVEVALPEKLRQRMPNGRGFTMGEFQIIFEPFDGPPHAHLSISHPGRYPTFEEMLRAARAPGGPSEATPNLWALVPKPEQEHSINARNVHLYVMPPEELLG